MPPRSSRTPFAATLTVPVRPPFRLDLTAAALRRLSTNVVDVELPGGGYARAFDDGRGAAVLRVHGDGDALHVAWRGSAASDAGALVERMFGTDVDLSPFYAAVAPFAWLASLVARVRGVKPPRYPTLWEAIVNAVVFQQVSIHAAAAILRRTIESLSEPVPIGDATLYPFPGPQRFLAASETDLRARGLSVNKVTALHALARDVEDGRLREDELEALPTPQLIDRLVAHRGIGRWTAAVISLRGFGRLDIFPMNDSGAVRSLRELSGAEATDLEALLAALGKQRGMLYYHLLLGRLAARGQLREFV